MKIDKNIIKELTDYLNEFNLTEIEYTEKDTKIKVSKSINSSYSNNSTSTAPLLNEKIIKPAIIGTEDKSKIIGTAYHAPQHGAKKFIEVGKKIKKGETIIIIEAMKTMNHIPSTAEGIVKEICVEDGQPVEYGQTIIIVE